MSRLTNSLRTATRFCKFCERPHYAKGYCERHYRRTQRPGLLLSEPFRPRAVDPGPCFCGRKHYAHGYCHAHYLRNRRDGEPGPADLRPRGKNGTHAPRKVGSPCTLCSQPVLARGYCKKHYARWHKHGDPLRVDKPRSSLPSPRPPCRECGEPSIIISRALCNRHYLAWRGAGGAAVIAAELEALAIDAPEPDDSAELDRRALEMMRSEVRSDAWQQRSDYQWLGGS